MRKDGWRRFHLSFSRTLWSRDVVAKIPCNNITARRFAVQERKWWEEPGVRA